MPSYNYRCKACDYVFSEVHSISERKEPLDNPCPNCLTIGEIYISISDAPVIGYHVAPGLRTSDNFNSRLKEIKKRCGKDNTIGDAIR